TQCDEAAYMASGKRLTAHGREFAGTFVSMGNPHFVIFTDNCEELDIALYGSVLERDAVFPDRCNIEFASVLPSGGIRCRVWERGSGITLACGTGACATSVAATVTGRGGRSNRIIMDGGTLDINWDETTGHVFMTGGAEDVFDGELTLREQQL
ncbi:MAG: diaminopimelate epimerase, partial [Prevotella sp.]|nr:diaminopimelate epimerase [Prevotella sp.]